MTVEPQVVVRPATPADGDAVGVLTEAVYRAGGFTDEAYSATLLDGAGRIRHSRVLVAELGGRIVGSLAVALPGTPLASFAGSGEAEVRMLAVAPDAQGRGVASQLMAAAEDLARAEGMAAVVLSTEPGMRTAQRLYRRRGYARAPERDRTIGRFVLEAYVLHVADEVRRDDRQ